MRLVERLNASPKTAKIGRLIRPLCGKGLLYIV